MAYEAGMGVPVITTGGGDGLGMGGIGGILIGSLLAGGGGLFGNRGAVGGAYLAATQGIQNQLNGMQSQMSAAGTNSEINELQNSLNAANIANLQGIGNNALLYQTGNAALQTAIAGANFTTLNSINGLGRDVISGANQNALQQLNSFNNLTTTTLQGFNEVGRDQANAFNQVQMSLNALAAQNASCCCELKSAIHTDGEMTRALINANSMASLTAQLSDAKSTINSLSIINALKPTATPVIV